MVKSVLFTKQKENNKKESDKDKEFLAKKRAEPDTPPEKDIDMVKLKKKINDIMGSICSQNNNENNNADYLYKSMHKNYVLNEFTSNCLNYINKIITDVKKNHLKKFQGLFELNKIFISIIKELLMNEFELLLLSLYLESIDISLYSDIFSFQESLIFLCFFIKKLTVSSEIISPINSFLIRKYQGFEAQFDKWVKLNSSIINNKFFLSYAEINQRFKEYNNSYSIYCKNNYIDYNLIIDRILTMSIPYNDCKNDNLFFDKKGNSSELGMDSFNFINYNGKNKKIKNKNNEIFFTTNNSNNNKYNLNNNINKINNLYAPNFISTFPNGIFINANNTNNPDINLGYLYSSNNNIYNHFNNNINNELISPQIINTEFIKINQSEPKARTTFKITNINNSKNSNISKNITNEDSQKANDIKPLFTIEEDKTKDKKDNIIEDENKRNNVCMNTDILNKNQLNLDKRNNKEISLTPNNLLYSLDNENNNNNINQNNHDNNNLFETIYRQINKDNININHANNNLVKNNEIINANQNQNNIIAFNASQQIPDFNALKYGGNLGVNDYNPPSFLSSKNPCYADFNNFYQSSFHPLDENMKQLYQSNENLFGSWINTSSKNFYPIINNNYSNKIGESGSINNINYTPINHMFGNNNALMNASYGLNNQNGKMNIAQEKKPEESNNQNNSV